MVKEVLHTKQLSQKYFIAFCIAMLPVFLFGQKLTAISDKEEVVKGETFQVTWQLVDGEAEIISPKLKPFKIIEGPNTTSNTTIIEEVASQSGSLSYILKATKVGIFIFEPASVTLATGEVVKSNSLTIKVLKKQWWKKR